MNCERCQIELEDFLYGEASERLAAEMRAHLVNCVECAALRADLEREHELFAHFYEQTAIDPSSETWEAIRVRIAAEPARRIQPDAKVSWWRSLTSGWLAPVRLRQAALALLLIGLSVATTIVLMKRGDEDKNIAQRDVNQAGTPVLPSPSPSASVDVAATEIKGRPAPGNQPPAQPPGARREAVKTPPLSDQELLAQQMARAEREYRGAIRMLDQAIAKRRGSLEPEAFKQYETSLALIDNSIAQSKRALREQPNDLAAGQFLLAAYAKKVELMQTIAMN